MVNKIKQIIDNSLEILDLLWRVVAYAIVCTLEDVFEVLSDKERPVIRIVCWSLFSILICLAFGQVAVYLVQFLWGLIAYLVDHIVCTTIVILVIVIAINN